MDFFDYYKGEGLAAISIIDSIFTGIFFSTPKPLCLRLPLGYGYSIKNF